MIKQIMHRKCIALYVSCILQNQKINACILLLLTEDKNVNGKVDCRLSNLFIVAMFTYLFIFVVDVLESTKIQSITSCKNMVM